jgi:aerobic-type carbon monoxide dehydrogenase small subunit (CoxS/CutS family)
MKVSLKVNGKPTSIDAPPDMPLLWVLRDTLDLKGTKYGCGVGQCGACTVHLKGAPARSCQLPVSTLQGAEITTIEGLSPDGSHPVQRAWDEVDVPQCGYCQAGQIMTAAALLAKTPAPTDDQITAAMNGNLCRCATYHRIRDAIHQAAAASAASPNAPAATTARPRQAGTPRN